MKKNRIRWMTVTAMLGALAAVLMFFSFKVPFVPSFLSMDFSELPALLAAFAVDPWSGIAVCLIKNVINVFTSNSAGVGELSNFLLGLALVIPAGCIYHRKQNRTGAIIGCAVGAVCMAVCSLPVNYYMIFPVYTKFMPLDKIIELYQALRPDVNGLWDALLWFNLPFTFVKAALCGLIVFFIYKPLTPILCS